MASLRAFGGDGYPEVSYLSLNTQDQLEQWEERVIVCNDTRLGGEKSLNSHFLAFVLIIYYYFFSNIVLILL